MTPAETSQYLPTMQCYVHLGRSINMLQLLQLLVSQLMPPNEHQIILPAWRYRRVMILNNIHVISPISHSHHSDPPLTASTSNTYILLSNSHEASSTPLSPTISTQSAINTHSFSCPDIGTRNGCHTKL